MRVQTIRYKISCHIMTNSGASSDPSRSIRCNWGQFLTSEMGQCWPRQSSSPPLFCWVSFLYLTQSSSSSSSLSAPLLSMPNIITLSNGFNLIIIRFLFTSRHFHRDNISIGEFKNLSLCCERPASGNFHFDPRSSPLELVPDETFLGKQCLQISNIITANCWIFQTITPPRSYSLSLDISVLAIALF